MPAAPRAPRTPPEPRAGSDLFPSRPPIRSAPAAIVPNYPGSAQKLAPLPLRCLRSDSDPAPPPRSSTYPLPAIRPRRRSEPRYPPRDGGLRAPRGRARAAARRVERAGGRGLAVPRVGVARRPSRRAARVAAETGWAPRPLVVREGGRLVAACPLYVKGHSEGEFVFDWGWADAAQRAGIDYYPKLLVGVPFTPVDGRAAPDRAGRRPPRACCARLAEALRELCLGNELSGVHVNFCRDDERAALEAAGFLPRLGFQYHWTQRRLRELRGLPGRAAQQAPQPGAPRAPRARRPGRAHRGARRATPSPTRCSARCSGST